MCCNTFSFLCPKRYCMFWIVANFLENKCVCDLKQWHIIKMWIYMSLVFVERKQSAQWTDTITPVSASAPSSSSSSHWFSTYVYVYIKKCIEIFCRELYYYLPLCALERKQETISGLPEAVFSSRSHTHTHVIIYTYFL